MALVNFPNSSNALRAASRKSKTPLIDEMESIIALGFDDENFRELFVATEDFEAVEGSKRDNREAAIGWIRDYARASKDREALFPNTANASRRLLRIAFGRARNRHPALRLPKPMKASAA